MSNHVCAQLHCCAHACTDAHTHGWAWGCACAQPYTCTNTKLIICALCSHGCMHSRSQSCPYLCVFICSVRTCTQVSGHIHSIACVHSPVQACTAQLHRHLCVHQELIPIWKYAFTAWRPGCHKVGGVPDFPSPPLARLQREVSLKSVVSNEISTPDGSLPSRLTSL